MFEKNNYFTDLKKLLTFLKLSSANLKKIDFNSSYPLKIPVHLAQKIKKNSLTDPLFLQFVPLKPPKLKSSFQKDPVSDSSFLKEAYLKKYQNRAIILCSNACAMHCRFCFRQNLSYPVKTDFSFEIKKIQQDKNLSEIILSGGDPLALNNQALKKLLLALEKIKHIKRIRIHSRFLIGCPKRLDNELMALFSSLKKPLYFVLHINHPKELDSKVLKALSDLKKAQVILMNQAVLLKGVNDNIKTLTELAEKLSNAGVFFYYLHQLDQVKGAESFEVKKEKGLKLIQQLQEKTSGYAVPKYVQEIPFKKSKTFLTCP